MGRIQSNIGLITGIPITDTVDQLMQIAARPRDLLTSRTDALKSQQVALDSLSSRLLSIQFNLNGLKVNNVYSAREISSSNPDVLTAAIAAGANPPVSSFAVRTVQTATAQQLFSQRFEDLEDSLGSGALTFGFGGHVDRGISLDQLNDGAGVSRGQIQVTDRSGASAVIDLTVVRSVDDVLRAINDNTSVNVTAVADGDAFKLIDNTSGGGTLSVQEVGTGTTAADLGLDGISTSSSEATGTDVFQLHLGTKLSFLNDSNGVDISDDLVDVDDLTITLLDGTIDGVDLSGSKTLGDVIDAIHNDAELTGKISAAISGDGNRLVLTDLTVGGGTFAVTNGVTGTAADDLGLTVAAAGDTITGTRLVSGLRDTLLTTLNGGQGLGTLGDIDITDRNAGNDVVDLSTAETLGDVIELINASTAAVNAAVNDSRGGITISDTSGGSGNLLIADSGATSTATALGIVVNASQRSVDSGTLNRQSISESTLLSSLNGGGGVALGDISITDTNGKSVAIDLNSLGSEAKTVGDIIDKINAAALGVNPLGVQARINDTGDGILIIDTVGGTEKLGVKDLSGTVAASLNLTRASTTVDINGTLTVVVDGAKRYSVDLTDLDGSPSSISLSSLNGGAGIAAGDFTITDSQGGISVLDFNGADAGIATIGELIDAINQQTGTGANVTASINGAGTGILLTDNSTGSGKLTVTDVNSTTAADLKIVGEATGNTINGGGLFSAQSVNQGLLDKLADRVNDLDAGVTAATVFDGLGFRLSLTVDQTGSGNELLLEPGASVLAFEEVASAQDALLVFGEQPTPGSGVLVSSRTNNFNELVSGVNLTAIKASETPVTVTVDSSDKLFVDAVKDFVDDYNVLRGELKKQTAFDEATLTTGQLFGTNEALRVDSALSRLVTDRHFGLGSFETLAEIGIAVDENGQLELDKAKLQEVFADNPTGLRTFFGDKTNGIVAKFNQTIDRLAGAEGSLLTNRYDALQETIESNERRIEQFNTSLDRQRERLLLQFYQLEQIIAGLQQNLTALQGLQPLAPLSIQRGN